MTERKQFRQTRTFFRKKSEKLSSPLLARKITVRPVEPIEGRSAFDLLFQPALQEFVRFLADRRGEIVFVIRVGDPQLLRYAVEIVNTADLRCCFFHAA